MLSIQRIRTGATGALMLVSFAACAGNLGNVLGSVLGGGNNQNELSGTIRSVDSRSRQISIQESNGQTIPLQYDNQTQVVYQNQNYPATALEYGDQVTARARPAATPTTRTMSRSISPSEAMVPSQRQAACSCYRAL